MSAVPSDVLKDGGYGVRSGEQSDGRESDHATDPVRPGDVPYEQLSDEETDQKVTERYEQHYQEAKAASPQATPEQLAFEAYAKALKERDAKPDDLLARDVEHFAYCAYARIAGDLLKQLACGPGAPIYSALKAMGLMIATGAGPPSEPSMREVRSAWAGLAFGGYIVDRYIEKKSRDY